MKKRSLLKVSIIMLAIVFLFFGFILFSKKFFKFEIIENAKSAISRLITDTTVETSEMLADELIEVVDISKPQTIGTDNDLKEVENLIGRYQFNIAGCGVAFSENDAKTNTGFSHIPICAPYEKNCVSHEGNSSGGYLDESYNEGGKIYKAYLLVEMAPKSSHYISEVAKSPITLLYGGKDGKEILSGIESTCTNFYYNTTCGYQGTGWIDVTDFIKQNGYGWYYGCNIPYGEDYNDMFSSWKLIVIEENTNIPVRKLAFSIGNKHVYNSYIDLSVGGTGIFTKKEGTVTGQLMYAATEVDIMANCCNITYSMDKSNFKSIETTNGVRTISNPLCMVMSRNGIPLNNRAEWQNHYYYTKRNVSNKAEFISTNLNNYPEATGDDFELLDVSDTSNKNNIVFENYKSSITLRFGTTSYWILPEFLGINVDIDIPEYTSVQSSTGHDIYYATVNGTITNNSTVAGLGMHDGKVVVSIDKGLKILSTNAYFTTSSGQKVNLTESMYTIDNTNNTITYIFGKDSNGKNLKGESLTYTVETQAIEADNLDGKKYIANNEVYANGKLTNNNVDTEHYMDKVVWDTSSVTIENPPYAIREELLLTSKVNLKLAEGKGAVELDWIGYDPKDRYFVIYRKEENSENFEKIVNLEDKLSANNYTDILGNDKAKPNAPTVSVGTGTSDIQISLGSEDNGTTYTYYIEAYDSSTNALVATSNKQSVKI